jgi:hypothetical protein
MLSTGVKSQGSRVREEFVVVVCKFLPFARHTDDTLLSFLNFLKVKPLQQFHEIFRISINCVDNDVFGCEN